jgi:NADH-quinone oxidoreductase subunit F
MVREARAGEERRPEALLHQRTGEASRRVYEASMHTTLRELIFGDQFAQGMAGGRKFKAIIPGGSSVPILLDEHLDAPASFDGCRRPDRSSARRG